MTLPLLASLRSLLQSRAQPPLPLGEGGGEGALRALSIRADTHPSPALRAASPRGRGGLRLAFNCEERAKRCGRPKLRGVLGLLAGLALVLSATSAAAQQASCTFTLGFAALHDLIPDVVGGCVEDEHHDPLTGDALQQTTNGLLVWRKADNWTAFTNGSETWVKGPLGLQQRQNDERFWWEANPEQLSIVPTPVPGDRCHTAGLSLELVGVDAGAGNFVGTFRFKNNLDVSCTFFGYPGAQLLDAAGDPVPTKVVRGGGYFTNNPPPSTVAVAPGATGAFQNPLGTSARWRRNDLFHGQQHRHHAARRVRVTAHTRPDSGVRRRQPERQCGSG